jgi:hypothetical protein
MILSPSKKVLEEMRGKPENGRNRNGGLQVNAGLARAKTIKLSVLNNDPDAYRIMMVGLGVG